MPMFANATKVNVFERAPQKGLGYVTTCDFCIALEMYKGLSVGKTLYV